MKTRSYCISIRRLKIHEFHSTLRYIQGSGKTWSEIYFRLGELQNEFIARLLKPLSGLFLLYILLETLGNEHEVSLTISGITASIPTHFVSLTASLLLLVAVQHIQTLVMLILIRAKETTKMKLRGFKAGSFGFYHSHDEMELVGPYISPLFFKEKLPTSNILLFFILGAYSTLLLPLLALWIYLFRLQFFSLMEGSENFLTGIVSFSGLFILVGIAAFIVLFNIPLPMQKNRFSIRFGFLAALANDLHPQASKWLDESPSK